MGDDTLGTVQGVVSALPDAVRATEAAAATSARLERIGRGIERALPALMIVTIVLAAIVALTVSK